jgi:hypothetical protein
MRDATLLTRSTLAALIAATLAALTACTAAPTVPTEQLDRDTGATVTSPAKPLLFVRSKESQLTAPFEYVTLVAVDVNQNSRHEHLLLAYGWTSLEAPPMAAEKSALRIVADDQVLELQPDPGTARDFGIETLPHAPPKGFAAAPLVYRCEVGAWQLLASSRQLSIQIGPVDQVSPRYEIWTDGRPALREMLASFQP